MRIRDWSSDVCSSDLDHPCLHRAIKGGKIAACTETGIVDQYVDRQLARLEFGGEAGDGVFLGEIGDDDVRRHIVAAGDQFGELIEPVAAAPGRSEEHTSELQSLMRISYAVCCLKQTQKTRQTRTH